MSFTGFDRAQATWEAETPHDECDCPCSEDRDRCQDALEEIAHLLNGVTASTVTDTLLDQIRTEADKR